MWKCANCNKENREDRSDCWNCSAIKGSSSPKNSAKSQNKINDDLKYCISPKEPKPKTVSNSSGNQNNLLTNSQYDLLIKVGDKLGSSHPTFLIAKGIIVAIIGIGLVILSPRFIFFQHRSGDIFGIDPHVQDLTGVAMFFGVALLIIGAVIAVIGFVISTHLSTQNAPITQPFFNELVSPKSIELGNTPDEVQSVMGNPNKIINLGTKVIHIYDDMKIIYDDGKVSDVQLS
jgi:hypothetical protein